MRIRLARSQLRYCVKVGMAAGLGYLLTQGNLNQYAIYGAFTAALTVGASVGEDLATSANRVKGTVAGMAAAMVATALFGPNALTVGLAVLLTTAIALASGWGIQVARVGVTICIITLVAHDVDALRYDLMRAGNTLIGVVVGLAVSFFVWPAHGPELIKQATRDVLTTAAQLLDGIAQGEPRLRPRQAALHDALAALVKAWRDMNREQSVSPAVMVEEAQVETTMRLGVEVLSCGMGGLNAASVQELRDRVNTLSTQG